MRKKGIKIAGILTCLCLAAGCAGQGNAPDTANGGTAQAQATWDGLAEGQQPDTQGEAAVGAGSSDESGETAAASAESESGGATAASVENGGVDIDLTQMSSTMVYSEVYNMMVEPERYVGKTVNMEGAFSAYYDLQTERYYYACIIQDATACCAQGIEFVLDGDYQFPDDYPEQGSIITVRGIFDTYEEDGDEYCQLLRAVMKE